MPKNVAFILDLLKQHNFEAFIVGGCVRDSVINRTPQDWDIATSATPQKIKELFLKTIDTGLKHGTVTVLINDMAYEITTYRIEGKYINNRRPAAVEFTDSIEVDLSRRDFTINAMAYNPAIGLIDPFGGLDDIQAKQIKAVGVANHRFEEDALRILRAVRFSAQLGYHIEENTLHAIKKHCGLLNNISGERIRDELNKILLADPMIFQLLHDTGILRQIMPELDICFHTEQKHPYHIYNVGKHSLHAANSIESKLLLRWTMLLHDIGKPMAHSTDSRGNDHFYMHQKLSAEKAEIVLQRLRFDNTSIAKIKKLILEHDRQIGDTEKSVRKAIAAIGIHLFEDWIQVRLADINAQNPDKAYERITALHAINIAYDKIMAEKQCLSLKDLAITGKDLVDMGFPQGKQLGDSLNKLLDIVLEQPELNERDILLELVRKMI
jgi:tRNA nucleotidyltransferase (CCA-adding enzyme)